MADEKKTDATPLDEPLESAGLKSFSYDDRIKGVIADWLQYELDAKRSETISTITDEKIAELKQRRNLGETVVRKATWTAGAILGFLAIQIILSGLNIICIEDLPQVILISASFLSCALIFGVLIKGLFYKPKNEPDPSPIKEVADILKHLQDNE